MISVERNDDGSVALFIDGDLQFDSNDEPIYHEALALPALAIAQSRQKARLQALIIGGGDGLVARELFKSEAVGSVDLVDYDPEIVKLASTEFSCVNHNSMHDGRLHLHVKDAWEFVDTAASTGRTFDLIIVDLTVPEDAAGARFHSIEWYHMLCRLLGTTGVLAVNGVSPQATPQAFLSIFNGMLSAGLKPRPYHVSIPSFSARGYGHDWGFFLAGTVSIQATELELATLAEPRLTLDDMEQVRDLFLLPQELFDYQSESAPGHAGSSILMHYFRNATRLKRYPEQTVDSFSMDLSALKIPSADTGKNILPPELRTALAECIYGHAGDGQPGDQAALVSDVLELMPALQEFHTEEIVADFVDNPAIYLQAIDIASLVERLLQRAAELPLQLVEELRHLSEKLAEWAGDYLTLVNLGERVITVLTLVVVVGNLMYPDAVYGKGEGAGAGHGGAGHGEHGGAGHGGRGGAGHGDHGGRGAGGGRGEGGRGEGGRGEGGRGEGGRGEGGRGEGGRGEGGRGDHGDHGGRGDHADRGDRGDRAAAGRGFDRADRGFNGARRGAWGRAGYGYGGYGGYWGHNWGARGWARPWNSGYWGGYVPPVYVGGGSWPSVNVTRNQYVDETGTGYPAPTYNYSNANWPSQPANTYNYSTTILANPNSNPAPLANPNSNNPSPAGGDFASPNNNNAPAPDAGANGTLATAASGQKVQVIQRGPQQAVYKLGGGADILANGSTAIPLTDRAFLMMTAQGTQVVDQTTGQSVLSLYNDPALVYRAAIEMKRQRHRLMNVIANAQTAGEGGNPIPSDQLFKIQEHADRLQVALQNLGPIPENPPSHEEAHPLIQGGTEVFASVWMTPDGKFLAIKRANGHIAYMNGSGWYSDLGKTKLHTPYPDKFKAIACSFLTKMVSDSDASKNMLAQDKKEGDQHMDLLNRELADYQADPNGKPDDMVDYGSRKLKRAEAQRLTQLAISRTQHKLDQLQQQIDAIPHENDLAKQELSSLGASM